MMINDGKRKMDLNDQQLAEINQLLSIAAYGKDKLDILANECSLYEQKLAQLTDRHSLKDFLKALRVFSTTLLTTIKSVADWRVKAWSVQDWVDGIHADNTQKRQLEQKIQQLLKMLESHKSCLQALQTRFDHLEQSATTKAQSLKTSMVRGKQVITSSALLETC